MCRNLCAAVLHYCATLESTKTKDGFHRKNRWSLIWSNFKQQHNKVCGGLWRFLNAHAPYSYHHIVLTASFWFGHDVNRTGCKWLRGRQVSIYSRYNCQIYVLWFLQTFVNNLTSKLASNEHCSCIVVLFNPLKDTQYVFHLSCLQTFKIIFAKLVEIRVAFQRRRQTWDDLIQNKINK